jgi:hypothetical protein
MIKKTALYITLFLVTPQLISQNSPKGLFSVFSEQEIATDANGSFEFSTDYSNSGSHWEIDWDESQVFF